MKFNIFKSSSLLKKYLIINFVAIIFLITVTFLYLQGIKPNLVNERSKIHLKIIENTSNHLNRLNIKFNKLGIKNFLLSTRFLFQNIDRVKVLDQNLNLLVDSDSLDLDPEAFSRRSDIREFSINEDEKKIMESNNDKEIIQKSIDNKIIKDFFSQNSNKTFTLYKKVNQNFFVETTKGIIINNELKGYITISEMANDIIIAVEERKNFILRTVFFVLIVILIFSLFLNKYILKPVGKLVIYTKAIKAKSDNVDKPKEILIRKDELGQLAKSLNEMTIDLQKRVSIAESFSSDLAHEIRNPLASLKGASEILETSDDKNKRDKLLNIISHDVERIERLITDYSQMLKDEADLSRSKMTKINLIEVIENVTEDFNSDSISQDKKIKIEIDKTLLNGKNPFILGVESKLEQIIANLLDNSISFSPKNSVVKIICVLNNHEIKITIEDKGPGFNEKNINQIFDRFYSNRPENFGKHSGLGLNIVKNIVELHGGKIEASNNRNYGARVDIFLPLCQN